MHGRATLNDGAFDEAALNEGDRIALGSVELEVVECGGGEISAPSLVAPAAVPTEQLFELETKLAEETEHISRLEVEAREGWQSSIVAAERADQLREALATAHEQLEAACRDLAASQESLIQQTTELDEARSQLAEVQRECKAIALQWEEARQRYGSGADESARLKAEGSELRSQLRAAEAASEHQELAMSELRRNFDQIQGDRERLEAEIVDAGRRLQTDAQQWNDERSQLERRLAQREAELESMRQSAESQTGVMTIEMNQLRRDVDATHEHWQSQCDVFAAQVADLEAELARREEAWRNTEQLQQQQAAERQRQADESQRKLADELALAKQELEGRSAELEALKQNVAAQQREAASATDIVEQAHARSAELDLVRDELAQRRALIDEHERELDRREGGLNDRQQQLEQEVAVLENCRNELQAQIARLEARRQELELVVAETSRPADSSQASADEPSAIEGVNAQALPANDDVVFASNVTAPWTSLEDLAASEATAAAQPVVAGSFTNAQSELLADDSEDAAGINSLLTRLVQSGQRRDRTSEEIAEFNAHEEPFVENSTGNGATHEVKEAPAAAVSNEPVSEQNELQQPVASVKGDAAPGEDESVEAYMERLLKRLRGDSAVTDSTWQALAQEAEAASSDPLPTSTLVLAPSPSPLPAVKPEEYVPRTAAPELAADLNAMRDVANSAARSAIEQHIRKHTGQQAAWKLAIAGLTMLASLLLGYWSWRVGSLQAGLGACVAGAIGARWTVVALRRMSTVARLNRVQAQPQPPQLDPPATHARNA